MEGIVRQIVLFLYKTHIITHMSDLEKCRPKEIYSKTQCYEHFLLDEHDLQQIGHVQGKNKKTKYYTRADVEKVALEKHGSYENLDRLLRKRQKRQEKIRKTNQKKRNDRRHTLMQAFYENKLEFKSYGDCYSYIHYGKPDIDTILEQENQNQNKKMIRRMTLAQELSKVNVKLEEKFRSCHDYIHKGGSDLQHIVEEAKIEDYLKKETDYMALLDKYPAEKAKTYAIEQLKIKKNIEETPFHDDFVVRFD